MRKISFKFSQLKRLHLHDFHVGLKGKMVPFAGYEMPVQYPLGVLKEHLFCREHCGLFDVSHMGQLRISGGDQLALVETITTGEFLTKKPGQSQLCLILNENAGIIDDTIVAKRDDHFHMVVNAGNKFTVLDHIRKVITDRNYKVQVDYLEDKPLIAVQGPAASGVVNRLIGGVEKLPFMSMTNVVKDGVNYQINRCGYTGEDGFEISVEKAHAQRLVEGLLKAENTTFCGLGARDSLRLEAGLCLHGHEMDDTVSPHEAKLMWTVRKKCKESGKYKETVPFIGRDALTRRQKEAKVKRMGFIATEGIVRAPADVFLGDRQVGKVSSGTFSPCLKKGIGFAFVENELAKEGTTLSAVVRGNRFEVKLATTPFVPQRYYRG